MTFTEKMDRGIQIAIESREAAIRSIREQLLRADLASSYRHLAHNLLAAVNDLAAAQTRVETLEVVKNTPTDLDPILVAYKAAARCVLCGDKAVRVVKGEARCETCKRPGEEG